MHTTNTTGFIIGFYQILLSVLEYLIMEEYETLSCVREYHEYQSVWRVAVGEELHFEREILRNPMDPYAVVVKKDSITVSHLPRKISRMCSLFLIRGGKFSCA